MNVGTIVRFKKQVWEANEEMFESLHIPNRGIVHAVRNGELLCTFGKNKMLVQMYDVEEVFPLMLTKGKDESRS